MSTPNEPENEDEQQPTVKKAKRSFKLTKNDEMKWKKKLKEKWLVSFPTDFFTVYELAMQLNPLDFQHAFHGFQLVGPFSIFTSTDSSVSPAYLNHRYYFDPPEMTTVLIHKESGAHFGYYRDIPSELPNLILHSKDPTNCTFEKYPPNLMNLIKSFSSSSSSVPNSLPVLRPVTAKTRNGVGIVVPMRNDIGYRELPLMNQALYKELDKGEKSLKLNDLMTRANIATDECDFGTGLQLGIDMFSTHSKQLESKAVTLMEVAYTLLNRLEFAEILQEHYKIRQHQTPGAIAYTY